MKNWIVLVVNLFSLAAVADLGGTWAGTINWSFQGTSTPCSAKIIFTETPKTLHRVSSHLDCQYVTMDGEAKTWNLQSGQIWDGIQVVGTAASGVYRWSEVYSSDVTIQNQIQVTAGHADYHERWIQNKDQTEIYLLTGRVYPQ